MATSGSSNYGATAHSIISEALEQIGVLAEGETPNQNQIDSCLRTLNMMVKSWQTRKAHMFVLTELFVFPKKNQRKYTLNASTSDHFTSSYTQTALAADASTSATTITVDSITGISNGDNIGIEVASNVVHWDTVNGAPSGSTVTLTTGLSDTASEDGAVFAYTSKANRPMKIYTAFERTKSIIDTPVEVIEYEKYKNLSNKTTDGRVNQIYYDPQISSPSLYIWPEPSIEYNAIGMWAQKTIEDFDAITDDVAFPQEWFLTLAFNLGWNVSSKYGVDDATFNRVRSRAMELLEDSESWDSELRLEIEPNDQLLRTQY